MSGPYGALKARLREGRKAYGCWIELFSPLVSEIIAEVGYDCVLVDLEHGPGSYLDTVGVLQAMKGTDCTPLARVPWNDHVAIKRVLDTGVAGVMVPSLSSAEEAREAVAACRYPQGGRRGCAVPIVRASRFGLSSEAYLNEIDEALLVIGQIESRKGVEEVEAIAAVDGLDMLFVGPVDLSGDIGLLGQVDHAEVQALVARVERATKAAGKLLGSIATPERSPEALFAAGYDLVVGDSDVGLLRDAALSSLAARRAALG